MKYNTQKQESVLVDFFDLHNPNIVNIVPFDVESNSFKSTTYKTTTLEKANSLFNIVGEIHLGEITLYEDEYVEDEFSEYYY